MATGWPPKGRQSTKRQTVHKKFEISIQQIIRFVAFVIFVASAAKRDW
jgi:hypothetical protein